MINRKYIIVLIVISFGCSKDTNHGNDRNINNTEDSSEIPCIATKYYQKKDDEKLYFDTVKKGVYKIYISDFIERGIVENESEIYILNIISKKGLIELASALGYVAKVDYQIINIEREAVKNAYYYDSGDSVAQGARYFLQWDEKVVDNLHVYIFQGGVSHPGKNQICIVLLEDKSRIIIDWKHENCPGKFTKVTNNGDTYSIVYMDRTRKYQITKYRFKQYFIDKVQ